MGCCGAKTEETEEVILSHDLEAGVDTTNDGTTADSEIHGFEENVEKSLNASIEDISPGTRFGIWACCAILILVYFCFFTKVDVQTQGNRLLHELWDAQTQDQLADLTKRVHEWYKKCEATDGRIRYQVTEALKGATDTINSSLP
eukprot:298203_1